MGLRPCRALITGSRDWVEAAFLWDHLDRLLVSLNGRPLLVVHGRCRTGADAFAGAWVSRAKARGAPVEVEEHPADWSLGRRGGGVRNAAMVAAGADICLAYIRNGSPGATGCARLAERAGIPTYRFRRTDQ